VRLLLDGGAKVNAKDDHGKTALHVAVPGTLARSFAATGSVIMLLVQHAANPRTEDNNGETLRDIDPCYREGSNSARVRFLLDH